MNIIQFCAEEVHRQTDTPYHVYHMLNAWVDAQNRKAAGETLSLEMIERWGALTSPGANPNGFRKKGVSIFGARGWLRDCPAPEELPELLHMWLEFVLARDTEGLWRMARRLQGPARHHDLTLDQVAYYVYELIHPFGDGNGRTGKIVMFWIRDELDNPNHDEIFPFFGNIANP